MAVWPSNIDSAKTRGQGRKVPQSRAVRGPSLKELVQASNVLGYVSEAVEGTARPSMPWEKHGYLVVRKPGPRIATLKLLAAEIARTRQREAQLAEAKPARK